MTEWLYEKKIIDLGSFSFLLHTYLYGVMNERNLREKGNMFPQRVLGDSFNVYLRLLIESMKNQKNVFMTSKFFIFINVLLCLFCQCFVTTHKSRNGFDARDGCCQDK